MARRQQSNLTAPPEPTPRRLAAEEGSRQSEVRFRSLFEGVPIGLLRSAPDGRIHEANPAAVRLLGFPSLRALLETRVETLYVDPADIQRLSRLALISDAVRGFQCRLRRADGGSIMARLNSDAVREAAGQVHHFETSFEDVTDLWESQRELKERNDTLEVRLAGRTRELDAVNQELETFAYLVSHDLRAPLRAIDGFSKVLLEDYEHQLDEAGQDSLHRIRAASQRMGRLFDDLLTLARTSRAKLTMGPVDLSAMAHETLARLRTAAPERQLVSEISPGIVAHGGSSLLRTALENLLANAWKFTERNPAARLEFSAERIDGELVCHVTDNGAGFDMAHAALLFMPFQRLHSSAEFPGNGVGLATVKRIMDRHGGRVWADGVVGQGAAFHFALPLAPSPAAERGVGPTCGDRGVSPLP